MNSKKNIKHYIPEISAKAEVDPAVIIIQGICTHVQDTQKLNKTHGLHHIVSHAKKRKRKS